jgi:hypothetical protein
MSSSKICFKCGTEKTIDQFYKHPQMADGHLNKCKECTKQYSNKYRADNIDKVREYDRKRAKLPERLKAVMEQSKKWRNEDKRRMRCHNAVTRALRNGTLNYKPCEWIGCHREDSFAHHESYDEPLKVVFYCQPHHKLRHKQMKAEGIVP